LGGRPEKNVKRGQGFTSAIKHIDVCAVKRDGQKNAGLGCLGSSPHKRRGRVKGRGSYLTTSPQVEGCQEENVCKGLAPLGGRRRRKKNAQNIGGETAFNSDGFWKGRTENKERRESSKKRIQA